MNIPQIEDFKNPNQMGRLHIQKLWPEFYEWILDKYKDCPQKKFSAYLYMYFHNMDEPRKCPVCGKYTPFLKYNVGFQDYCSLKCSNLSPEVQKKKEETSIKNWGTPSPAQSKIIKDKVISTYIKNNGGMGNASKKVHDKFKETMIEKYGVENALECKEIYDKMQVKNKEKYGYDYYQQRPDIREKIRNTMNKRYGGFLKGSDIIREKINKTNIERYGDEIPNRTDAIKEKAKQTCLDKYGVEYFTQTNKLRNITRNRLKKQREKNRPDIIELIDENTCKYICPHPECDKCKEKYFISDRYIHHNRTRHGSEICTKLNPVNSQVSSLELFVKSILDRYNIEYEEHNRDILNGLELDFYIPSRHLAIECNGVWWHDENHKPKDYHFKKWNDCRTSGIKLISIWEDWVIRNEEWVENLILRNLGIYEIIESFEIKELSNSKCDKFLNRYYIYGTTKYGRCIGLYNNDCLIGVVCVINRKGIWSVVRYCVLPGVNIINGLDKAIEYLQIQSPQMFISNDMGIEYDYPSTVHAQYKWYIDKNYIRHHSTSFNTPRKEYLGIKENFDEYFTTIYDSGMTKYLITSS